jgi:hypothetical protein
MSNTNKRENIKTLFLVICSIIAFLAIVALVLFVGSRPRDGIVIDCTWSEISPDFTTEMRQACRNARANNFSKDLQKPK